jgi:uncharacterized protein with FMN-binding domain
MKGLKRGFLATSLAAGVGGGCLALLPGGGPVGLSAQGTGGSKAAAVYALNSGQFVGSREYAFYGYVKVRAIVQDGRLTDVVVLEFPSHAGRSRYISGVALPYLVEEALSVQNARVDFISGATLTSEAFSRSLDAALKKAGA